VKLAGGNGKVGKTRHCGLDPGLASRIRLRSDTKEKRWLSEAEAPKREGRIKPAVAGENAVIS